MKKRDTDEGRRGQMLVMAPIVVVVFTAMLAFTADVGGMVLEKARLQGSCDAAALAGTQVLFRERVEGLGESDARAAAREEAIAIFRANSEEAAVLVEFGNRAVDGTFVLVGTEETATAVRAAGMRCDDAPGGEFPLFFAAFFKFGSCEVAGAATAEVTANIGSVFADLGPFAVPEGSVPGIGEEMVFYPADADAYDEGRGEDTVAPGCWGLLNLDGGSLGTTELVEWIRNGYDGGLEIDPLSGSVWVDGASGFRAALEAPLIAKIGEPMIFLVYDQVIGSGAIADFRCVGFVRVTITAVQLTGKEPYVTGRVETVDSLHNLGGGGGTPSPNIRKIQLIG